MGHFSQPWMLSLGTFRCIGVNCVALPFGGGNGQVLLGVRAESCVPEGFSTENGLG